MGFRQAIVLGSVSFFLGVLFICFNVDHKLLWGELTEETIQDGMQFYTTFYGSPPAIKVSSSLLLLSLSDKTQALLHGLVGLGLVGLVSKLHNWDDSAMFFDGSCLCEKLAEGRRRSTDRCSLQASTCSVSLCMAQ